jgi:hypothetical protein
MVLSAVPAGGGELPAYHTHYYVIHSDLPMERVREAAVRLNTMAEEYHRRTRSFSGAISRRMPFYLFAGSEAYQAAGAPAGSVGVYDGRRLMALGDERVGDRVWSVVQHEGFHQFAHRVITPRLPVWVNEGLAEYFGEAVWTGDGFVTGLIPPERLKRLRKRMAAGEMLRFSQMLEMSQQQWNAALKTGEAPRNYDQAWSMVHFLVHADDGRYREAFADFINDISAGASPTDAFQRRFGGNVRGFEQRYAGWWRKLPARPTRDLEVRATVATLTSFLARATAAGKAYSDADAFFEAAAEGELAIHPSAGADTWLPQSLLRRALKQAKKLEEWSLVSADGSPPELHLRRDDVLLRGTFRLREDARPEVTVTVSAEEGG